MDAALPQSRRPAQVSAGVHAALQQFTDGGGGGQKLPEV